MSPLGTDFLDDRFKISFCTTGLTIEIRLFIITDILSQIYYQLLYSSNTFVMSEYVKNRLH